MRFGSSEFYGIASSGSRNSSVGDVYQEGKITVERDFDLKGETAEIGEGAKLRKELFLAEQQLQKAEESGELKLRKPMTFKQTVREGSQIVENEP